MAEWTYGYEAGSGGGWFGSAPNFLSALWRGLRMRRRMRGYLREPALLSHLRADIATGRMVVRRGKP